MTKACHLEERSDEGSCIASYDESGTILLPKQHKILTACWRRPQDDRKGPSGKEAGLYVWFDYKIIYQDLNIKQKATF